MGSEHTHNFPRSDSLMVMAGNIVGTTLRDIRELYHHDVVLPNFQYYLQKFESFMLDFDNRATIEKLPIVEVDELYDELEIAAEKIGFLWYRYSKDLDFFCRETMKLLDAYMEKITKARNTLNM